MRSFLARKVSSKLWALSLQTLVRSVDLDLSASSGKLFKSYISRNYKPLRSSQIPSDAIFTILPTLIIFFQRIQDIQFIQELRDTGQVLVVLFSEKESTYEEKYLHSFLIFNC